MPVSFHALGELYETLRDMAIRDPLTRTYNRALFEDRLKQAIAEHRRNPTTVAILLIDMVRFKYVNDLLGHHTGDLLLKQVVARISSALRESDTLARMGGDEFTVVLSGVLHVEHADGVLAIAAGQAVVCRAGEWVRYSTPGPEGAQYIAVCLPAFSPDTVHRDE